MRSTMFCDCSRLLFVWEVDNWNAFDHWPVWPPAKILFIVVIEEKYERNAIFKTDSSLFLHVNKSQQAYWKFTFDS